MYSNDTLFVKFYILYITYIFKVIFNIVERKFHILANKINKTIFQTM